MRKKVLLIPVASLMFAACGGSTASVNNSAVPAPKTNSNDVPVVSSHSTDKPASAPSSNAPASASQPASPNQMAVDVKEVNAKIEKADKDLKAKPTDAAAKKALADAYFERAFALTKAAQYRAALGDFRKGLKLDSTNKEAQDMHDQIISIFKSIGREPPKEGEEPAAVTK